MTQPMVWTKIRLLALGAAGMLIACSRFPEPDRSPPRIIRVLATDVSGNGGAPVVTGSPASENPEVWKLTVPAGPDKNTGVNLAAIRVQFNKLLDGSSIQATLQSCTAASDLKILVNGAEATSSFSVCYDPSSPEPGQGASILFYPGTDLSKATTLAPASTYELTGTIADQLGQRLAIDVQIVTP